MSDHTDGASPSGSPEIVKTIFVRTTPERLFPFFTDPAKMLLWIGTEVELDARPGGMLRIVPNRVDVIRGTYLEITPPTRVVFTWGFEGPGQALPAGASVVEIVLRPVEGGTEVRLTHRALPDGIREAHAAGWTHYLDRIATAALGGVLGADPLADPSIRHGAPAEPSSSKPNVTP
jgi:uncharacterized protein YndB with AHSA1/START domain